MADLRNLIDKGVAHSQRAIELDRKACEGTDPDLYHTAKNSYMRAIDYYSTALKHEKNNRTKHVLRDKVKSYLERADEMSNCLEKYKTVQHANPTSDSAASSSDSPTNSRTNSRTNSPTAPEPAAPSQSNNVTSNTKELQRLRNQLGSAILTEKPDIHWDDVIGLEGAKDALKEAVILPKKFPQVFVGKRKPWRGILLYGPPGTGKSHLARAIATEADCEFFSVSSSDLVSKWQGESERLVGQLFAMARASGNAIIFIDEIDALVSSRSESESESSRRIKTEFLVQMDGVGKAKGDDGVLLLGATNIPWGLDDALLRRMERRVYIPLPDNTARAGILRLNLGSTPNTLQPNDFSELAQASESYSGSDLAIVVRDAIMQPVRKMQSATHFRMVSVAPKDDMTGDKTVKTQYEPCLPGEPDAIEMNLLSIKSDELFVPLVSRHDFDVALSKTKPSVGMETLEAHEKFTLEKGQSGA